MNTSNPFASLRVPRHLDVQQRLLPGRAHRLELRAEVVVVPGQLARVVDAAVDGEAIVARDDRFTRTYVFF